MISDYRDLPFTAAEAAIDIDNYTRGEPTGTESISQVYKFLLEITQGERPRATLPDYLGVLTRAIPGRENYKIHWKGKSVKDYLLETRAIAEQFENFKNLPKQEQESLGEFCVNLSRETAHNLETLRSTSSRLAA